MINKGFSFTAKVLGGSSLLFVFLILQGYLGISALSALTNTVEHLVHRSALKDRLAADIDAAEARMLAGQRGMILYAYASDQSGRQKMKEEFFAAERQVRQMVQQIRPLLETTTGRAALSEIEKKTAAWISEFAVVAQLAESGKPAEAWVHAYSKTFPLFQAVREAVAELKGTTEEQMRIASEQANSLSTSRKWWSIAVLLLAALVGSGVFFVTWTGTTALRRLSHEVHECARHMAHAAAQVSESAQSLAQGASEQAASNEETSASVEEINAMAANNSASAKTAAELAVKTEQSFEANNVMTCPPKTPPVIIWKALY